MRLLSLDKKRNEFLDRYMIRIRSKVWYELDISFQNASGFRISSRIGMGSEPVSYSVLVQGPGFVYD